MKAAALLILILSHQGYWFGGKSAKVTLQWALPQRPAAVFIWELQYGHTKLSSGRIPLPVRHREQAAALILHLQMPQVRVRMPLTLAWRLVSSTDATKVISRGTAPVVLFPDDLLDSLRPLLKNRHLWVLDRDQGLPALLDRIGLPYHRLKSLDELVVARADVLLVGPGQLETRRGPFAGTPLMRAARRGMSIMILRQEKVPSVAGFRIVPRLPPRSLVWRKSHALFRGLSRQDLRSWLAGWDRQPQPAIQTPADAPALALAWWPVEKDHEQENEKKNSAHDETAPPDSPDKDEMGEIIIPAPGSPLGAAVLTQTIGKGRIVLWQIPLDDWRTDPRSQILLVNAIDYLLTPPQPTLSRKKRHRLKRRKQRLTAGERP